MTVGEAVIRTAAQVSKELRTAGWNGVVVKWGDDVIVPSVDLTSQVALVHGADVIRFGALQTPDTHLSLSKEWLQTHSQTRDLVQELSRQPLADLRSALSQAGDQDTITLVNLGGFAATHEFLSVAVEVFGETVFDAAHSANWDPYFWQCLLSTRDEWDETIQNELQRGSRAASDFDESFPNFFDLAHELRDRFEIRAGRKIRVQVMDFGGDSYWIDAGSHKGLSEAISDLLTDSPRGSAARALLGFPDSVAQGASFIAGSEIETGCIIENSIILSSRIGGEPSRIQGAIVLGSNVRHLWAEPQTIAIWTKAETLRLKAPRAFAFKLSPEQLSATVSASATTLMTDDGPISLVHDREAEQLTGDGFSARVGDNPISYAQAALIVQNQSPLDVHEDWLETIL